MNKNCKMTIGAMLLLTTAFSAFSVNAQTCAVPPTCESLGYDKSADECVDKAVLKCPFDENKIFCSNGIADGVAAEDYGGGTGPNGSYQVGDQLTCKGKPVGYVISVSTNGSGGKIAALDYESNTNMGQDAAKELCKAKTDCNLAWNLVTSGEELSLICKAKKQSMGDTITQAPSSLYPAYYTSGSGCSSTSTTKGKPYCTASFATDKNNGGASTPSVKTYKVGDTYSVNGVAMGKVVEVDSTGQHGVLAVSMGQANAATANATCTAKTNGGLNWGLATGRHACAIGGSTSCFDCSLHTSGGSGYCSGGNISSTCGSGCTASTVAGYVCEAPF